MKSSAGPGRADQIDPFQWTPVKYLVTRSAALHDRAQLCRSALSSWLSVATLMVALLLVAGCSDDRVAVISVEGQVTRDGGGWGRPGIIYFAPLEPASGYPRLPGIADVDKDGRFQATTQPDRQGLVPGKYRASLEIWEVPPTMGGPPAKSYVPKKYRTAATSDLVFDVPADSRETIQLSWDIPLAK